MRNEVSDRKLLIEAGAKAVVCVLLVLVVAYSVYAEVSIDADMLGWIASVLAVYFGVGANSTFRKRDKRQMGDRDG